MINLNSVVFPDIYPKLDLHGCDRETARVMINDFINDNIFMKNNIIVIIHGIGSGILKAKTHEVLKQNSNVIEYKLIMNNIGSTIVLLKRVDK